MAKHIYKMWSPWRYAHFVQVQDVTLPAGLLGIVQDLVVEDGIVECQTESNWVSWLSKHVMKVENIIEVIFDFVTLKSASIVI